MKPTLAFFVALMAMLLIPFAYATTSGAVCIDANTLQVNDSVSVDGGATWTNTVTESYCQYGCSNKQCNLVSDTGINLYALALFMAFALICVGLGFWKDAPYMAMLGGITLILIGIYISTSSGISGNFGIAIGAMLMFAGMGVGIDTMIRNAEHKGESQNEYE